MKEAFLNNYFCGVFSSLSDNGLEIEKQLNEMGKDIGQRVALLTNFQVEDDFNSLVYRIVFEFLPNLYETDRKIEKVQKNENEILFLIYEQTPLFPSFNSSENSICPSSLFAGVVESILNIFNMNLEVLAYNAPVEEYHYQVVYVIKNKL